MVTTLEKCLPFWATETTGSNPAKVPKDVVQRCNLAEPEGGSVSKSV